MPDFLKSLLGVLLFVSGAAFAAPSDDARGAIALLDKAVLELEAAQTASDRVAALTGTVQAFETGLAAMRAGTREVAIKIAKSQATLAEQEVQIAGLTGVLLQLGDPKRPAQLLHPGGVNGAARAQLIVSAMTPELTARADRLQADLGDLAVLRDLQAEAERRLLLGAETVHRARAELIQAVSQRSALPQRFTVDPLRAAVLIASSETLEGFASGLALITTPSDPLVRAPSTSPSGALALPVRGILLRGFGDEDAAGITRPGIIIGTAPRALVMAPMPATIRYVGPLLDLGNVVILEPRTGSLIILSGLGDVFAKAGQVVMAGDPLGLMADLNEKIAHDTSIDGDDTGLMPLETLYIEVRQDNVPVDPAIWFRTDKDG